MKRMQERIDAKQREDYRQVIYYSIPLVIKKRDSCPPDPGRNAKNLIIFVSNFNDINNFIIIISNMIFICTEE